MFFLKNQNLQMRKMIVSKECDEIYQTEQIFFFCMKSVYTDFLKEFVQQQKSDIWHIIKYVTMQCKLNKGILKVWTQKYNAVKY